VPTAEYPGFEMKWRKKKIIISTALIAVASIIAIVVYVQSNDNKSKNLIKALQESADLKIKGFTYTEVGKAKDKWEVKAETATYDKKQNLAVLERVQIKLTTVDGRIFVMNADKGRIITDKKDIEINGNVVMISDNGYRFYADYLNYNDAEKKIFTEAPVTMENKEMKVTGKGMTLYINKGELNIPSTVKAKLS